MVGMFGNGFLQTSSPLSPSGSSVPSGENTARSMPSPFTALSPAYDGSVRVPWKNEPHSSVPPDILIWQTGPNASTSHLARGTVRTAPVDIIEWSRGANDPDEYVES